MSKGSTTYKTILQEIDEQRSSLAVLAKKGIHEAELTFEDLAGSAKYKGISDGNYTLEILDEEDNIVHSFPGSHGDEICFGIGISNTSLVISGSKDLSIKVWDIIAKSLVHVFKLSTNAYPTAACEMLNTSFLVFVMSDYSIKIWDLKTRQVVHTYEKTNVNADECIDRIAANSEVILMQWSDETIQRKVVSQGHALHQFKNQHHDWVNSVVATSDSNIFLLDLQIVQSQCGISRQKS